MWKCRRQWKFRSGDCTWRLSFISLVTGLSIFISFLSISSRPSLPSWRRKWQPTPVFLPGESHGQRSFVGYSPPVAKSRTQLSDFTFTFTFIFTLHMWRNYPECSRETERCMQSIWEISCKTWKKSLRDLEDKHVQKSPNGYFKGKKCERMGERNNVKMHHSSEFSKLFKDKSSISGNWMNFK